MGVLNVSERNWLIESNSSAKRDRFEARALPVHLRKAILRESASTIEYDQDCYAVLIVREGIKTSRQARLEVARCIPARCVVARVRESR